LVVISGCSGGGKSTLLSELRNQGYSVIEEVGRNLSRSGDIESAKKLAKELGDLK
jgi:predicted ATPase